jgi:hypothetical protein
MKRWGKQRDTWFDEKELKTDLGTGNFIFVGSSCDMWAKDIPNLWIFETLKHCWNYGKNEYLYQSKNPERFKEFYGMFRDCTFGTTIETNRKYKQMGNSPLPEIRMKHINEISKDGFDTMVTIEPIFDFDFRELSHLIKSCSPEWVNIGADSGAHKLPEPPAEKVIELITELKKFTEVKIKKNLNRILRGAHEKRERNENDG